MLSDQKKTRPQIVNSGFQIYDVPRAINVPSKHMMQNGMFKTVEEVRDCNLKNGVKLDDDGKPIVVYSNQALAASVGYFCMAMAGIDNVSMYDQGLHNFLYYF